MYNEPSINILGKVVVYDLEPSPNFILSQAVGLRNNSPLQSEVNVCYNRTIERYYWVATPNDMSAVGISSGIVSYNTDRDSVKVRKNFEEFAKINNIKNFYFK